MLNLGIYFFQIYVIIFSDAYVCIGACKGQRY